MASRKPPGRAKRGRPAKVGEHRQFALRLRAELHRQLRHYALDQAVSLNDLIVRAVEHWWGSVPDRATYARLVDRPARKKSS